MCADVATDEERHERSVGVVVGVPPGCGVLLLLLLLPTRADAAPRLDRALRKGTARDWAVEDVAAEVLQAAARRCAAFFN